MGIFIYISATKLDPADCARGLAARAFANIANKL